MIVCDQFYRLRPLPPGKFPRQLTLFRDATVLASLDLLCEGGLSSSQLYLNNGFCICRHMQTRTKLTRTQISKKDKGETKWLKKNTLQKHVIGEDKDLLCVRSSAYAQISEAQKDKLYALWSQPLRAHLDKLQTERSLINKTS